MPTADASILVAPLLNTKKEQSITEINNWVGQRKNKELRDIEASALQTLSFQITTIVNVRGTTEAIAAQAARLRYDDAQGDSAHPILDQCHNLMGTLGLARKPVVLVCHFIDVVDVRVSTWTSSATVSRVKVEKFCEACIEIGQDPICSSKQKGNYWKMIFEYFHDRRRFAPYNFNVIATNCGFRRGGILFNRSAQKYYGACDHIKEQPVSGIGVKDMVHYIPFYIC
jgi:hypothetical protein